MKDRIGPAQVRSFFRELVAPDASSETRKLRALITDATQFMQCGAAPAPRRTSGCGQTLQGRLHREDAKPAPQRSAAWQPPPTLRSAAICNPRNGRGGDQQCVTSGVRKLKLRRQSVGRCLARSAKVSLGLPAKSAMSPAALSHATAGWLRIVPERVRRRWQIACFKTPTRRARSARVFVRGFRIVLKGRPSRFPGDGRKLVS